LVSGFHLYTLFPLYYFVDGRRRVCRRVLAHHICFSESLDVLLDLVPDSVDEKRRWVRALRE